MVIIGNTGHGVDGGSKNNEHWRRQRTVTIMHNKTTINKCQKQEQTNEMHRQGERESNM